MLCDEISCLVDRVVERVRANRIIVSVTNIDTRNSNSVDERGVVTSGTKDFYSTEQHVFSVKQILLLLVHQS